MISARRFLVHLLAIVFGMSSWVEMAGLGVEMPLLVQIVPEGWSLGSYIVIIQQFGNLGPIAYYLARKYLSHSVVERPSIYVSLTVAVLSWLLLSFFWKETSIIRGQPHSTALFVLAFFLALVDSTTTVLYLPYMASFREVYVISCMIGEGACTLVPSIAGFIQGVGITLPCPHPPYPNTTNDYALFQPPTRFPISTYFLFLMVMVITSWMAFVMLDNLPYIQSERAICDSFQVRQCELVRILSESSLLTYEFRETAISHGGYSEVGWWRSRESYHILLIQSFTCLVQLGILPSIQPFSCMPYGSISYHLAVNLSFILAPFGFAIAYLRPAQSARSVFMNFGVTFVLAMYIFIVALMSPNPPLRDYTIGRLLIVSSWVSFTVIASYVKASIAAMLLRRDGKRALFWGGFVSQWGSGTGGIFMFIIVNFTNLFKSQKC